MRLTSLLLCGIALLLSSAAPVSAESVDLSQVAAVEDLAAEVQAKLAQLDEQLKDDAAYEQAKAKLIPQTAGVVAVLGQAIAEHPEKGKVQVHGADLRDAAHRVINASSRTDALAALDEAKKAAAGESNGAAASEFQWNKLINLHRLMEEVNARNSKIRRVLRRPRDPQEDSLHATTLAVLGLVIQADTHEVKNEADLPAWQEHAQAFQTNMTATAAALKEKDTKKANALFLEANRACNKCHEKFRVEP